LFFLLSTWTGKFPSFKKFREIASSTYNRFIFHYAYMTDRFLTLYRTSEFADRDVIEVV
jgi:hypothetical protein